MESFIIFTESTNREFVIITTGLMMLALSASTKSFLGNTIATSVNIIGILLLSYAVFFLAVQIKKFYENNPSFLTDYRYETYRQNIYAGIGVCAILLLLICYASFATFF